MPMENFNQVKFFLEKTKTPSGFIKFTFGFLVLFFLCSCSLAPLMEPHTANTLGAGKKEWSGMAGVVPFSGAVAYQEGVADDLDLGLNFELQGEGVILGLSGKYLLTPKLANKHLSLIGGTGIGSIFYVYAGTAASIRVTSWYELAANVRLNLLVSEFELDLADEEDRPFVLDETDTNFEGGEYSYVSLDISQTFWMKDEYGLTLSTSGLFFVENFEEMIFKAGVKFHYKY